MKNIYLAIMIVLCCVPITKSMEFLRSFATNHPNICRVDAAVLVITAPSLAYFTITKPHLLTSKAVQACAIFWASNAVLAGTLWWMSKKS